MVPTRGQLRKHLINALDSPGSPALRTGHETQVLIHGQTGPTPSALRNTADAQAMNNMRFEPRNLAPLDAHASRSCTLKPDDRVAQRRLAHTIAANDRKHTTRQRERHPLHGVTFAIVDVKVVDLQRNLAQTFSHPDLPDRSPEPLGRSRFPAGFPP